MFRCNNGSETVGGQIGTGGITTSGSPVITNLPTGFCSAVNVGDWCDISLGYDDDCNYEIIAKTATTITVETNASSSEVAVVVTTIEGMFTDGVPAVIGRTDINAREKNIVQEEIVNVLLNAGIGLDEHNTRQLADLLIVNVGNQYLNGELTLNKLISAYIYSGSPSTAIDSESAMNIQKNFTVQQKSFLKGSVNEIAGSDTDITGTELETLSGGTDTDASVTHSHRTNPSQRTFNPALNSFLNTSVVDVATTKNFKFSCTLKSALISGASSEISIIETIPGMTDTTLMAWLNFNIIDPSGVVIGLKSGDGMLLPFTAVDRYSWFEPDIYAGIANAAAVGSDDTLASIGTRLVIAIKKIANNDYDLVLFNYGGTDIPINTKVYIDLSF